VLYTVEVRLVNFKSLTIKNFLSVGETPVTINFQPGVNVITGTNYDKEDSKNGVGKSTIADALYFALFGTTIRELSKDLIVNSFTKKKCEVMLDIDIENGNGLSQYRIVRTINPTKCHMTKNGEDITRSTMAKTNEFIQKLVLSNGKIFQNSVIMTINNTVPFMAQSKVDKRKFIESILSLEIFSDMLSKAREEHNELKKDYEVLFTKIEGIEKGYMFNKEQLDAFEENKRQKIEALIKRIEENKQKIEELKKSIKQLPDDVLEKLDIKIQQCNEELQELQKLYKNAYQVLADIKSKICHIEDQLKEIEKVGAICTTCKRAYSDDDLKHKEANKKELNSKLKDLTRELNIAQKELDKVNTSQVKKEKEIKDIQDKKNIIRDVLNNNKNIETKYGLINETIQSLLKEIEQVKNETNKALEEVVKDLEEKFKTGKQELVKLDHNCSVLEVVRFVVSEEGVKSYIVKKILAVLNGRMAYYLDKLHANCLCQFNEFFDELITDEKGEQKSYFNFSGGERKRIDLACLFSFLDIRRMQGDVHFSTIFYDELLDSSLDDKGVELVLDILRERAQKHNENCYIITHRGTTITEKIDNTVFLEKRNNFTYLLS
jgi:DNA repair exonuclease SbcCD ATPase subunit